MEGSKSSKPGLKELRDAVPRHCFLPSNAVSLAYIARDVSLSIGLAMLALKIDPISDDVTRWTLWTVYGIVQGMVFTGIWILAHECGHQALFTSGLVNDSFGFILHSILMVPYFSWKYSHSLHHRYTNHMEKDTVFVPFRKHEKKPWTGLLKSLHAAEDAPALSLITIVAHQLFGWPAYMLLNISAGMKSTQRGDRASSKRQSHFDPLADIFSTQQYPFVLLSDIGLAMVLSGLYFLGCKIGFWQVALLYGVPYLWVNNWISMDGCAPPARSGRRNKNSNGRAPVAITRLHHTHPSAHHFEADRWNFRDGALSTIDRDFGLIGRHLFHGIIEFHVVHHLFTRIPFYHAEEATKAISGMLGESYLRVETSFWMDFWNTFRSCRHVEQSKQERGVLVWSES